MGRKKTEEVKKVDTRTCRICQHENSLEARVCESCGGFLPNMAAVEASMQALNAKYSSKDDTKLYRLSNHPFYLTNKPPLSTGSLKLDRVLLGGYPMTYRIEIAGEESTGKTTLALHATAAVQRRGGVVCYIDMEHALDDAYAQRIGVNLDELIIARPDSGTQAMDIIVNMAPAVDLIVLDSVATCASTLSLAKESTMDSKTQDLKQRYDVADLPRLMSDFQNKLLKVVDKSNCTYIFINQIRTKISQMPGIPASKQTPGGRAMRHLAQLIIWLKYSKPIYGDDEIYQGTITTVEIRKAKHMGGYAGTEIRIGPSGIDYIQELLDLAIDYDIINKTGAWYSYDDGDGTTWKCQGEEKTKEKLASDPVLIETIDTQIRNYIKEALAEAKQTAHVDNIIEEEGDDGEELEGDE